MPPILTFEECVPGKLSAALVRSQQLLENSGCGVFGLALLLKHSGVSISNLRQPMVTMIMPFHSVPLWR